MSSALPPPAPLPPPDRPSNKIPDGERISKYLDAVQTKSDAFSPQLAGCVGACKPAVVVAIQGIQFVAPWYLWLYSWIAHFGSRLPAPILKMVFGAALCFFGGTYVASIAAIEGDSGEFECCPEGLWASKHLHISNAAILVHLLPSLSPVRHAEGVCRLPHHPSAGASLNHQSSLLALAAVREYSEIAAVAACTWHDSLRWHVPFIPTSRRRQVMLIVAANEEDDAVDKDKDGRADVLDMDPAELAQHKL